jgi:hypothetical protein
MYTLSHLYRHFFTRSAVLVCRAEYIQTNMGKLDSWQIRVLTEGMLSDLWQLWCWFCRHALLLSCGGTIARSGAPVIARVRGNSWQRIGYEAICGSRGQRPKPIKRVNYRLDEPTWGNQDKIIDIVICLNPSNKNTLLSAFGLPLLGPKHLQIVRNACAHKDIETMKQVRDLLLHYTKEEFLCSSDLAWQLDPTRNICAIYSWIFDMRIMADLATATP